MNPDEYDRKMTALIQASRQTAGWDVPWFVAQATYHPGDGPKAEIREAQKKLWESGLALQGPDTDPADRRRPRQSRTGHPFHRQGTGRARRGVGQDGRRRPRSRAEEIIASWRAGSVSDRRNPSPVADAPGSPSPGAYASRLASAISPLREDRNQQQHRQRQPASDDVGQEVVAGHLVERQAEDGAQDVRQGPTPTG